MDAIPTLAGVPKKPNRFIEKSKSFIKHPIDQQPTIRDDLGTVKFQPHTRVKIQPIIAFRTRTNRMSVGRPQLRGYAALDITMSELATVLFERHTIRATPAMLSRHLIHRLNDTYKKIPDRYGKTARTRTCRAIRVDAPASTKDAS